MTTFLTIKALHIIFMVTWFAGLFYLPRLYVYHAMADDSISIERFKVMERKLYYGITTPGMILTILFGLLTIYFGGLENYLNQYWLHAKLLLILILVIYHFYCGKLLKNFKQDNNQHGHVWYRFFNEIPVLFLIVIVLLAVTRPF